MFEIDFELHVQSDDLEGEAFMNYVDDQLYEKYQGDISPVVRSGELIISGTAEVRDLKIYDVIAPLIKDLEQIGLQVRGFEILDVIALT